MSQRHGSWFNRAARTISGLTGHPLAFATAVATVLAWAIAGPLVGFNDTWQLSINTGTTIATFLMVFLIQNAQNRDSAALQLKRDELIRAGRGTHNALLDIEELSQEELEHLRARYEKLAAQARRELREGGTDTGAPDLDRPARLQR